MDSRRAVRRDHQSLERRVWTRWIAASTPARRIVTSTVGEGRWGTRVAEAKQKCAEIDLGI